MGYATVQNMIERFSEKEMAQLSDRVGRGENVDASVVQAKLADADAEIDGYLQTRYALPLASVPPRLVAVACDLARYHLYDDRATEQVTIRYKDAITYLRLLAKGEVTLAPAPGDDTPAAGSAGTPMFDAPDRVFTAGSLKDFTS